ncbi:MAG: nicotinate-nucleotide adenylyltransferase [Flavobacteriales bacterium]|nr:nicotinate-nucleotide adenylyltransferase [Flavobacteriia bacterium]NCP06257.1 nicotinate-nucleotide adenylyltransferase [Flavobacteriales bacterium]PIV95028.1 MAG: nicotinate-nucleotide adenylyltransferase [Flavobacteriaceae bacterium CG17_big_fil_post_rev_8_21_14_2_50_33_15]PIY11485.1 MAG: nicotinate-nucleotide adenylyltransferase [Flavobacteriaceae bacterium CG_4_10_14_3_um_filter_33_47]PJB17700.1 MAG: nicotinate-nucleotide adenylyltransferase [Flavobacteriaceae bacterium CG_4_9_14_3_um_f
MKKLIFGLIIIGFTAQMNSQTIELKEVEIVANYDYSQATNTKFEALPVQKIQEKLINYKATNPEIDDYGDVAYSISFYTPDGKIIADYNTEGNILSTSETYKNVRLPLEVLQAIAKRFPNWTIVEDTYHINFHCEKGITQKVYKIKLMNEEKVLIIKANDTGKFM